MSEDAFEEACVKREMQEDQRSKGTPKSQRLMTSERRAMAGVAGGE